MAQARLFTTGPAMDLTESVAHDEASSAKLSFDISELVSRALGGETIDMPQEGAKLALRYPELGMSGEMIGSAIGRALDMIGTIRTAPLPPAAEPPDQHNGSESGRARSPEPAAGPDLADVLAPSSDPILLQEANATEDTAGEASAEAEPDMTSLDPKPSVVARLARGKVAAVRRALFRT